MTLRLKINLIVGALVVLLISALLWLEWRGIRESVHEEVVSANRVAAQMLNRTAWRYAEMGTPAMLKFLQGIGRVRSNDITLLDSKGTELYRSPPSQYKAGRDAPAWFDALVAPLPSVQAISFPDSQLVVRSNASRAVLDAWDDLTVIAGSGVVLLLVTNTLVFWLVGRAVRPFGQIVAGLNQLQAGRFDVQLPRLAGREAATIGAAFNRMVGELQGRIETERRAARAELQLSDSRDLTRWIDQHIERERHMIARELHDELGQSVTAMRSMALSIAQRIHTLDPQSESAARLIADEASRLYDAMHGIIPRLTPLLLDSFGLAEALNDLVERLRRSHTDVQIALEVDLGGCTLASEAALALYRAAQEGINNALQHGHARHLRLAVTGAGAEVTLTLQDDGCGLIPDWSTRTGHYGLRWLTERVESIGGELAIQATQPGGVRLSIRLPLAAAAMASAA
ncbi:MAG: HAMP domain-containing protein [Bacteriovorax sp.]|nr:HAMP domain-containing protein [Rhizobacter sp.]